MKLSGPELQRLRKELLDATSRGRVQDWVERIADIARDVGLPLERISWQGSPESVAFHVIMEAERYDATTRLSGIIAERRIER